jgi:hypothetical protein
LLVRRLDKNIYAERDRGDSIREAMERSGGELAGAQRELEMSQ